jgi:hypothetical protein
MSLQHYSQKPKSESNLNAHWHRNEERKCGTYLQYYLAKKWKENERNSVTCENMDGARGLYAKWNKSDSEGQILLEVLMRSVLVTVHSNK